MADKYSFPDAALQKWESLAARVTALLGEGSFSAIYARSVFQTRLTFTWLPLNSDRINSKERFSSLQKSLHEQTVSEAHACENLLVSNFANILVQLIGRHLVIVLFGSELSDICSIGTRLLDKTTP